MKKSLGARALLYPSPVLIVGTYDQAGMPNFMTVAWGGICASKPPCVAVSIRKATYTHGNILEREAFTVGIPSEDLVREADYFGIASGRDENKLDTAHLTPVKSSLVDAPYVEELPLSLECGLSQIVEIGSHTQFVGEILDIKAEESFLGGNGLPDIEKVRPMLFDPASRKYHGIGEFLGKAFSIGRALGKAG